jgi:rubrerythrin
VGLLPRYEQYPKKKLKKYLDFHENAKLTPTLAYVYPDLAEKYPVQDWFCTDCGEKFAWSVIRYSTRQNSSPSCPTCEYGTLRGSLSEESYNNREGERS